MALLQDVRTKAKHRGLTPWQLVQKIARLDAALDEATCKVIELTTEVDELKAERNRLEDEFDKAAIDRSAALEDLAEARAELAELRAFKANATAATVPPMQRDTSALADQATEPINVRPLWQALNLGPTAATTNPGRLPCSWGVKADEPEPAT